MAASKKPKPEGYIFGRPTLYETKYCQLFIDELKQGKTLAQARLALSIPISTFRRWVDEHEDFRLAIETGQDFSEAKFREETQNLWVGEHVNTRLIELHARNCYKWSTKDKDNITIVGGGDLTETLAKVGQIVANNNPQASK